MDASGNGGGELYRGREEMGYGLVVGVRQSLMSSLLSVTANQDLL